MYDYIFAGAGCAALSLAYKINQEPTLRHKKILLIDKSPKNANDRTWCFWTKEPTAFDSIACQDWTQIFFHAPPLAQNINILPYHYKMIRGIDFYNFIKQSLAQNPNITWLYGNVEELYTDRQKACIQVEGQTYQAAWAFNSIFSPPKDLPKPYRYLLQHFKGWVINTENPVFQPQIPTFMDFSVAQTHGLSFMYVLPAHEREALVEFTLFSENVLTDEQYEQPIMAYLQEKYNLQHFSIREVEKGIIPMTNAPFSPQHSPRIANIGTQGGHTKASTGYTFMNIQRATDQLLQKLKQNKAPFLYPTIAQRRFNLYDATLLEVLATQSYEGRQIFRRMFAHHPVQRVFRFLDNQTHIGEELQIMASMPMFPFLKAMIAQRKTLWH